MLKLMGSPAVGGGGSVPNPLVSWTITSPTISAPDVTGGTFDGPTITDGSWTGGQIINAPLTNPTMTTPTITLGAMKAVVGVLSTPAGYTFNGDDDTGIEDATGGDRLGLKVGGVRYVDINHGHTASTGQLVTIARTDASTGTIVQITQGAAGGSSFLGYALAIDSNLAATTNGGIALRSHITAQSGTDGFYTAGEFQAKASTGWTPTTYASGPIGIIATGISDKANTSAWGANIKSRGLSGATGLVMCGIEINMQAEPGSGVTSMYGMQVVPTTVDTGTGNSPTPSGTSIGYRLIGKAVPYSGGGGEFRYGAKLSHGIMIENLSGNSAWASGSFPLQSTGTAFEVRSNFSGSPQTIDNGIVFTDITMTGYAWKTKYSAISGATGFAAFGAATPAADAPLYLDAQSQTYLFRVANGPTAASAGAHATYIPFVYNGSILKFEAFSNS